MPPLRTTRAPRSNSTLPTQREGLWLVRADVAAAPHVGPHASQEFGDAKRLFDVVVGAGVERAHLVLLLGTGREDDDRQLRVLAHRADEIDAVAVGQAEIDDGKVEPVARLMQALAQRLGLVHGPAIGPQRRADRAPDVGIVLDDQRRRRRRAGDRLAARAGLGKATKGFVHEAPVSCARFVRRRLQCGTGAAILKCADDGAATALPEASLHSKEGCDADGARTMVKPPGTGQWPDLESEGTMVAKSLFVSHISEEAEYAALLKEMIQSDFLELARCFTSSDIGSIGAGENWLTAVERAMSEAKAVIVLCSKASVHRPWVQFEVGAAWMKDIPVIPVCHSGLKTGDLQMPLSLRQGVELPTERGIAQLYEGVAKLLKMTRPPKPSNLADRLRQMKEIETRLSTNAVQQFELFLDIVLAPPGRLQGETIPDDAVVESEGASLELFGFLEGAALTWRDIVRKAQKTPDTRWLRELQRSIALASNNERFRPVQAVYHTTTGSYQPQLSKKEIRVDGSSRFHVHFVATVVAPLSEVQNDFGMLATLLRLGLRFRYEVIERFQKLARARSGGAGLGIRRDAVKQLREAIEIIENDALSRGAEQMDRDAVIGLFDSAEDQEDDGRSAGLVGRHPQGALLHRPSALREDLARVLARMRSINYSFMKLGTRRFHELVKTRWAEPVPVREALPA